MLRLVRECGWIQVAFVAIVVAAIFGMSRRMEFIFGSRVIEWRQSDAQDPVWVNITILENAVQEGGVCLDGSPPAYHLHKGSGSGSKNWLIFLEGGGWCSSHDSCERRSRTALGSSAYMASQIPFSGILGSSSVFNPDFYNWNRVKVRYCDGASFSGEVKEQTRGLYYRGQRVWRAVISDLLQKGMIHAEKALLAGCSAGGLAATLHCNSLQEFLPGASVKCLNDGGYFMDVEDVSGKYTLRSLYKDVVDLQNVQGSLPQGCISKYDSQCFFPHYVLPHVQGPVFFVNAAYDIWQIQNVLIPDSADRDMEWYGCKINPYICSQSQLNIIQDFRTKLIESISQIKGRDGWSMFINSCFIHCQTEDSKTWNHMSVGNKTIVQAVGDWYFDRTWGESIDCAYPCNPTCVNWEGWGH